VSDLDDHEIAGADAPPAPAPAIGEVAPSRRPTPGEAARTLVQHAERATLSTLAQEPAGYPFGSVAPYGLLDGGSPVLCISRLAEHTRNLDGDGRASLFVTEAFPMGDPMDNGRLTLLGTARRIEGNTAVAREAFLARHPEGRSYVDFGDFAFWQLDVEAGRWVGGFGRMAWCTPEEYREAEADPTPPVAPGAVTHLNADHAEAMLDAARAFTGHADAVSATAVRLDRYGIDLEIATPRGLAFGRAPFDPRVEDADGLRMAAVRLARAARGDA
jgi:putative heme iron utilization protein